MIYVRPLLSTELDLLKPIGDTFTAEASHPGGFNSEHFSNTWSWGMQNGIMSVFIAEKDCRVIGALGAAFLPDAFSGQSIAVENFWFVFPEFRDTGIGLRLLERFEEEAKARNCRRVAMVHLANLYPESLRKLYVSRGFKLGEETFWKEI